ncbi:hypothetical protein VKT23_017619 [Stygiomarasmius scandens]|uniref:Uncharacterized protein n=1 Tax=Marasmiellus scandens TaxID=2682957 RepID=A0ABR1IRP6_9AGAR
MLQIFSPFMFLLLHILPLPFLFSSVLASPIPIVDVDIPEIISDVPKSPYVTRFSHRIQNIGHEASARIWEYVNEIPGLLSSENEQEALDIFAERALEEPIFISVRGISPPAKEESYSIARRSIETGVEEQRRTILDLARASSSS